MIGLLRRALQPLWRRQPALRSLALDLVDLAARPLLRPFTLGRPAADPAESVAIEARTGEFNRAAEEYFASPEGSRHLVDKPFSEPESLSRRLIDVGVLLDALRLRPGDTVLELGAGTCWLSHLLNRFGCRTIAIDVSANALSIGRKLFESDPRTNWDLQPTFLAYDGHALPVPAGSIDRVVLYDAYHHLPNPRQLLTEIRRVLRPDGIAGMSEPGRGHTASASSRKESSTGVLERELVLEDIADLALGTGFAAARVVVAPNRPLAEIDAHDLRAFMGGRGFARYWKRLCAELDGHHYIVLFAGDPAITTARPKDVKAILRAAGGAERIEMRSGESRTVTLDVQNAGDTTWLHCEGEPGWTRLGTHLYRADRTRTVVNYDWLRVPLPRSLSPEDFVRMSVVLPPIDEAGDYEIACDLVIEGVAWFADLGSMPLVLRCQVR